MENTNTDAKILAIVEWTHDYLNSFGGKTKAVIGISGGKDSSVAAAVCVKAVGKERVIGVMMPNGSQHDLDKAEELCSFLGIKSYLINIKDITKENNLLIMEAFGKAPAYAMSSNMPARVRMTMLYNVAAMVGDARVVNTCNRSEDYVGYSTKFGDAAGDFSPLSNLTVREVKALGRALGLPADLVDKVPEDGLSGKTDEDNLGFTYDELDDYLLLGKKPEQAKLDKIERMHALGLHKLLPMPKFEKESV